MSLQENTIPIKTTGDQLTSVELNELASVQNNNAQNAVSYTDQTTKTDAERAQARVNMDVYLAFAFNVKKYGATGDGATDDTVAIQSCIDAAATAGAAVYFPSGEYRVDRTAQTGVGEGKHSITLRSNVKITGESRGRVIIKPLDNAPSNMPILLGASGDCDHITISCLTIDGHRHRASVAGGSLSEDEGINFKDGYMCRVIDCEIFDCGQDGIDHDAGSYGLTLNCYIHDCWGNGIHHAGAGHSRGIVENCIINSNGDGRFESDNADVQASAAGVDFKGGTHNRVFNTVLSGNARGIVNYGAVRVSVANCEIVSGNTTGGAGVSLRGAVTSGSGSIRISDTYIVSPSTTGGMSVEIVESFNEASFMGVEFFGRDGIVVKDGRVLTVGGGCKFNNTNHGIQIIENNTNFVSITDSIFWDGLFGNSLRVENDAYGLFARNTMLKSSSSYTGVDLRSGSGNWEIVDNYCPTSLKAVRCNSGGGAHVLRNNSFAGTVELTSPNNKLIGNKIGYLKFAFSSAINNAFRRNEITGSITPSSTSMSGQVWKDNYGSGAYAESGTATLVAGTVTVSSTIIPPGAKISITRQTTGGTVGHLSVGAITAGTSFIVNSSEVADTSEILWKIEA